MIKLELIVRDAGNGNFEMATYGISLGNVNNNDDITVCMGEVRNIAILIGAGKFLTQEGVYGAIVPHINLDAMGKMISDVEKEFLDAVIATRKREMGEEVVRKIMQEIANDVSGSEGFLRN